MDFMSRDAYNTGPLHRKQSAYLLHGSLILVQVKYNRPPSARPRPRLAYGDSKVAENYGVYACTDNFMPRYARSIIPRMCSVYRRKRDSGQT